MPLGRARHARGRQALRPERQRRAQLERRIAADLAAFFGEEVIRRLLDGNEETEARIDGKPVVVSVNAYIKPGS